MSVGVDHQRLDALGAAVAAGQEGDAAAVADQHPRKRQRGRRLAGAAGNEVADTDRRRIGALAGAPHAARSRSSVKGADRMKQTSEQGRPAFRPESR